MTTILPTGSQSPTAPASAQAGEQLNVDYENFLQLLTAQISNQDPLAPMESTEFVSQLAQLSQVEQSIQTNTNLEAIAASMEMNSAKIDLGLLDRHVWVATDTVRLGASGAELGYQLPKSASQAVVTIRDQAGQVVRRMGGPTGAAGEQQTLTWDGTTDAGDPAPEALYTFSVTGFQSDGSQFGGSGFAMAQVASLSLDGPSSELHLDNGQTIAASHVLEVR